MTKNSKIPTFTLSLLMPREIHSNENTVSFLRRFTIGKSNILSIVKFSGLFAQILNYHPVIFFFMSIPEDLFGRVLKPEG